MTGRFWIFVGLTIFIMGCATVKPYTAADFHELKPKIRRIAVFPFSNETKILHADSLVRKRIVAALSAPSSRRGPEFLPLPEVESAFTKANLLTFEAIVSKPLIDYQNLLGVDAVLLGQVSQYHEPTPEERFGSLMWNAGQATGIVIANLQLYRCEDSRLLWQMECRGVDYPWLAIQGAFTSVEGAARGLAADARRNWPWTSSSNRRDE